MHCVKCKHDWKRTKLREYFSFLNKCPNCESRIGVMRNDFLMSIVNLFRK